MVYLPSFVLTTPILLPTIHIRNLAYLLSLTLKLRPNVHTEVGRTGKDHRIKPPGCKFTIDLLSQEAANKKK
jgi:hypothetical protein